MTVRIARTGVAGGERTRIMPSEVPGKRPRARVNFTCLNICHSALQQLFQPDRWPSVRGIIRRRNAQGGAMPRVTLDDPDDTLSLLRESVAQFAAQHDGARILRKKRAGAGDLDRAVWTAM